MSVDLIALDACSALHVAALMAWFGALSLRRVLGAGQGAGEMRFLWSAGGLALATGAAWPWLEMAHLSDEPGSAWGVQQVAVLLTQTSFGRTWLLREAAIALAAVVSFAPLLAISRAVYFLVAATLAGLALLGHAAGVTGPEGNIQRLVQAAHLLAAGAWVGALPALWVLSRRLAAGDLARVLQRFSAYGAILVAVVIASGTASAWWRLGEAAALWNSDYGRILLGKLALVGLMGALALRNRNQLTPQLLAAALPEQERARTGLRWTIGTELVVGVGVVLVAVVLGTAEAPQ